jgi:hypothetical protein
MGGRDVTADEDDNVLSLRPEPESHGKPPLELDQRSSYERCVHTTAWVVDAVDRVVLCKTCGAQADPVTVLYHITRDMRSQYWRSTGARDEIARLEQHVRGLKKLKSQLTSALARLRKQINRLPDPDPKDGVPT